MDFSLDINGGESGISSSGESKKGKAHSMFTLPTLTGKKLNVGFNLATPIEQQKLLLLINPTDSSSSAATVSNNSGFGNLGFGNTGFGRSGFGSSGFGQAAGSNVSNPWGLVGTSKGKESPFSKIDAGESVFSNTVKENPFSKLSGAASPFSSLGGSSGSSPFTNLGNSSGSKTENGFLSGLDANNGSSAFAKLGEISKSKNIFSGETTNSTKGDNTSVFLNNNSSNTNLGSILNEKKDLIAPAASIFDKGKPSVFTVIKESLFEDFNKLNDTNAAEPNLEGLSLGDEQTILTSKSESKPKKSLFGSTSNTINPFSATSNDGKVNPFSSSSESNFLESISSANKPIFKPASSLLSNVSENKTETSDKDNGKSELITLLVVFKSDKANSLVKQESLLGAFDKPTELKESPFGTFGKPAELKESPFGTFGKPTELKESPFANFGKPKTELKESPFASFSKPKTELKESPFGAFGKLAELKEGPFANLGKPKTELKESPFGAFGKLTELKESPFGAFGKLTELKESPFANLGKPKTELKESPFGAFGKLAELKEGPFANLGKPKTELKESPFGAFGRLTELKESPFGAFGKLTELKESPFANLGKPKTELKESPFGAFGKPTELKESTFANLGKPKTELKESLFASFSKPKTELKESPFANFDKPKTEQTKTSLGAFGKLENKSLNCLNGEELIGSLTSDGSQLKLVFSSFSTSTNVIKKKPATAETNDVIKPYRPSGSKQGMLTKSLSISAASITEGAIVDISLPDLLFKPITARVAKEGTSASSKSLSQKSDDCGVLEPGIGLYTYMSIYKLLSKEISLETPSNCLSNSNLMASQTPTLKQIQARYIDHEYLLALTEQRLPRELDPVENYIEPIDQIKFIDRVSELLRLNELDEKDTKFYERWGNDNFFPAHENYLKELNFVEKLKGIQIYLYDFLLTKEMYSKMKEFLDNMWSLKLKENDLLEEVINNVEVK